jgi:hypothetical protein
LFYQWCEKSGFEIHFQAFMHPAVSWGPTGRSPWVLENDRMSFVLPYPIFYLRSAISFCDSATERIEFRADVADPIPKRFFKRSTELLPHAVDAHQNFIITSTHILKSIHPKHIPYLIYSNILKNVGVSAVFC